MEMNQEQQPGFLERLEQMHERSNHVRNAYYDLKQEISNAYQNDDTPQELIERMNLINELICDPQEGGRRKIKQRRSKRSTRRRSKRVSRK